MFSELTQPNNLHPIKNEDPIVDLSIRKVHNFTNAIDHPKTYLTHFDYILSTNILPLQNIL